MSATFEALAAALVDRYRIDRELGAGGKATVYLAEDLKRHRKVEVKVLRPELATSWAGAFSPRDPDRGAESRSWPGRV